MVKMYSQQDYLDLFFSDTNGLFFSDDDTCDKGTD